jgi:hypothetical protein
MKLLSDSQLSAVQRVAKLGMQTDVTIFRRSSTTGLELTDDPYGSTVSYAELPETATQTATVKGMLHSAVVPTTDVDSGQLVTVNTFRLWVPVGTDIRPGDQVQIAGNIYQVTDTTADQTWPPFLECSLRRSE